MTSPDEPGLLLSGADRQKVWNLVGPTLKGLIGNNRGLVVDEVFYPSTTPNAANCDVAVDVRHFVISFRDAA